jgi:hypothetical protein
LSEIITVVKKLMLFFRVVTLCGDILTLNSGLKMDTECFSKTVVSTTSEHGVMIQNNTDSYLALITKLVIPKFISAYLPPMA